MKPRIARIGPKLLDPQSVIFFRASPLGRFLAGPASYDENLLTRFKTS
jgi:hypothetical protein